MLPSELGQRIRSQREKRGLKQQDLAHALQVSPQAVSKWERGENAPDIMVLGALARLLGVSTDWLLGATGPDREVFEATVVVSSIQGAYEKSVGMNPRDFAAWANGYHLQITEAVLRYDGVPIKYLGDEFLCFFSGVNHSRRAIEAVRLARNLISETDSFRCGISSGEVYFGEMGHPDYASLDIMGETVNLAFLTLRWAETKGETGVAALIEVVKDEPDKIIHGKARRVKFLGFDHQVEVCELSL